MHWFVFNKICNWYIISDISQSFGWYYPTALHNQQDNDMWNPLQWRHNERDGVPNHQPYNFLLMRLFRHRSKKTSKLRVNGLGGGIHRWALTSPHKGPVTRKMFPFDDIIMVWRHLPLLSRRYIRIYIYICIYICDSLMNTAWQFYFFNTNFLIGRHPPQTLKL